MTTQAANPIPPNQGCTVFHTPRAPCLIFWPRPNSIRNRGIPSNMSMMKKGMRNAPKIKQKRCFIIIDWEFKFSICPLHNSVMIQLYKCKIQPEKDKEYNSCTRFFCIDFGLLVLSSVPVFFQSLSIAVDSFVNLVYFHL